MLIQGRQVLHTARRHPPPKRRERRHGNDRKGPPGLSGLFTHSGGFPRGSIRIDEDLIDPGALCLPVRRPGRKSALQVDHPPGHRRRLRRLGRFRQRLPRRRPRVGRQGVQGEAGADAARGRRLRPRVHLAAAVVRAALLLHRPRRRRHGRPHALEPGEPLRLHAGLQAAGGIARARPGVPQHRRGHHRRTGRQRPQGQEDGFVGCKDHSYRGVRGNTELGTELRRALGDDFILLHDPVESYTCMEAIQIGRQLEKLNYTWIEEPPAGLRHHGVEEALRRPRPAGPHPRVDRRNRRAAVQHRSLPGPRGRRHRAPARGGHHRIGQAGPARRELRAPRSTAATLTPSSPTATTRSSRRPAAGSLHARPTTISTVSAPPSSKTAGCRSPGSRCGPPNRTGTKSNATQ